MGVEQVVAQTRAIQWWIDKQIARGRSDDEIALELPVATAFITGRLSLSDLVPR
jgi:hypothetical protein